jgi:hypothetical protein
MQWKLVSAFATGAVLASGIVYVAVRPQEVATKEDVPKPVTAPQPTPQVVAPPVAPAPVAETRRRVPARVREKPSPMPPPVRHQQELLIARNDPPPVRALAPVESKPAAPEPTPPPPAAEPAPAPTPAPVAVENVSLPAPPPEPPARVPNTVTLAAGTMLAVRIGETVSSARNQPGDTFLATLTQQLVIDGFIIAERGARIEGRILEATQAGRGRGSAHLAISIVRLTTSDGQDVRIRTEPYSKDGSSQAATDAAKVGGGAAIGAVIGAIAGGGKGAGIGAGAGGAVGAGDVMLTRGKPVEIPVETRISFRVQDPVTITERLD